LFILYISSVTSASPKFSCVAYEFLDEQIEEEWDFRIHGWENFTVSISSSEHNIPPYMSGVYTYRFSFCDSVVVYMGNGTQNQSFGWSFGSMSYFAAYDVAPKPPSTHTEDPIHEYNAYHEFSQFFGNGDTGSPCSPQNPRSAVVNIYCGLDKANCTQVPFNKGPACIDGGTTKPGFCLCSVHYNTSRNGICSGLDFNILSNNCTQGKAYPIVGPSPYNPGQSHVGIAVAVIVSLIFLCCIFGFIYNTSVHGKRGCHAIPFYDTCTGNKHERTAPYDTAVPSSSSTSGAYGAT